MGPYTATYFSNWGATTVDLSAPGSNILSTIPNGKYAWYRGTSMATPHVTGLVALLASAGVPTSEIKERLRTSVVSQPIEGRPTKTDGRANAYRALYGSDAPSDY
jgi:subtilisin family serine protease